jgi:hypothetical protein
MLSGTSPSIKTVGSGFMVAVQTNGGVLWDYNGTTGTNLGDGMHSGSSPSGFVLSSGIYWIAFEANVGTLWYTGTAAPGNTSQAMDTSSSPAGAL